MDRPIIYTQENIRGYDLAKGWQDALKANGKEAQGILGGTTTVAAGLPATPTSPASLSVNIGTGSIFQLSTLDPTSAGDLPVDGGTYFMQGILWNTQGVTLSTSALSAGQSQWALIQATFGFVDVIRSGDPNAGVLPFYNSANPSVPLQGQGGSGASLNTERTATVVLSVVYGTPATTGSETPPSAGANNIGLYLIDLTYGQTTITSGDIFVAGPSVGTGVPSNYPYAPFLAGLLNQHHKGIPGQAPQIDLTQEVKNILPASNLPFTVGSGNFTATLTGFTTTVTTAVYWQQIGYMVMWKIEGSTGTSNSTAFGMTGIPTALLPATNTTMPMGYTLSDNGSTVYGDISFGGGGQPVFTKAGSTLWTASGTKGIFDNVNICYTLFTLF